MCTVTVSYPIITNHVRNFYVINKRCKIHKFTVNIRARSIKSTGRHWQQLPTFGDQKMDMKTMQTKFEIVIVCDLSGWHGARGQRQFSWASEKLTRTSEIFIKLNMPTPPPPRASEKNPNFAPCHYSQQL